MPRFSGHFFICRAAARAASAAKLRTESAEPAREGGWLPRNSLCRKSAEIYAFVGFYRSAAPLGHCAFGAQTARRRSAY